MNEALLGGSLCPPSEFQTFWRRHFRKVRMSLSYFRSNPRFPCPETAHAPRTPGLRLCVFYLAEAAVILPAGFAQISREKKNFRYFIWFELIK